MGFVKRPGQPMTTQVWPEIQLRRKHWVTIAIRTFVALPVKANEGPSPAPPPSSWAGSGRRGRGRQAFLSQLERCVQRIRVVGGERAAKGRTALGLEVAGILAASVGRMEDAEALHNLRTTVGAGDDGELDREGLTRQLRDPMQGLGEALQRALLADDHPLLDGAFHQLLHWRQLEDVGQLAEVWYSSPGFDERALLTASGEASVRRLHFVEAVIGLVWADGRIDPMEQRLLKELVGMGSFTREDVRLLWHMLGEAPPSPADIATQVLSPQERSLLLDQLILASLVDGEVDEAEQGFLETLTAAFGLPIRECTERQLRLIAHIEAHPEVLGGLSVGGVMGRLRRHAHRRVEAVVRENLEAIVTEVRETGDLFQLLIHATHTELTPDEMARVRAQLIDICKTIPSLALLAAPGGTILLPILIKILPFSLMPSAFEDKDEAL